MASTEAVATVLTAPEIPNSGADSSLVPAGEDATFTSSPTLFELSRAPPGGDDLAAALFAADWLHDNDLSLSDSSQRDEGGFAGVNESPDSAADNDALARAPPLAAAEIASVLDHALQLWAASGLAGDSAQRLSDLNVQIADLQAGQLGWAEGLTITLDTTAAGRGWFVDPTPAEHSEFGQTVSEFRVAADADSAACGRIDLLTVLLHEIGHVLGFDHEASPAVMAAVLATGERVLLADAGFSVQAAGSVTSPLTGSPAGTLAADDVADTGPITFRIFNGNGNAIPDVEVTGAVTGDAVYDDIVSLIGSLVSLDDTIVVDIDQQTTWSVTGPNAGSVAIDGFSAIQFSNVENLAGAPDNEDTFVFEAGGSLSGEIDGGVGGFDSLVIQGTYATVVASPTGPTSGTISLDGVAITYTGLEPVDMTGSTIADLVFNLPGTADQAILEDDGTTGNGISRIRSQAGTPTFETTTFGNTITTLTVNMGGDSGALTVDSLPDFTKTLIIAGQAGADTVNFTGTTTFTALTVSSNGDLSIAGNVHSGSGDMTLVSSGGSIVQTAGNVSADDLILRSATGITLGNIAVNSVTATNTTSGGVALTDAGGLLILGITNPNGAISVTTTGNLTITGIVTSGSNATTLTATGGTITWPQLNDVIDDQLADFLDPTLFPGGVPASDFMLALSIRVRISDLLELVDVTLTFRDLVFVNTMATAWTGFVDLSALAARLFPDDATKRSTIADAPAAKDLTASAAGVSDDDFAVTGAINLDERPRTSDLQQDRLFFDAFVTPIIAGKVDLDSSGVVGAADDGTLGTRIGAVGVVDGSLVLPDPLFTFLAFGLVGGGLRLLTVSALAGSLDINGDGVIDASDNGVLGGAIGAARGLEDGLGWPGWVKVEPTFQKLFWNNFRNDADYVKPRLKMDADLDLLFTGNAAADAILGLFFKFGGRVTGLVFDLELRQQDKFPVVEIGSASANIAVTLFGLVDIQGAFTLGLVKVDAGGNLTEIESQVADRILYGAVQARAFISKLPGQKAPTPNADGTTPKSGDKGFGFAMGLSEFGPLQVFLESPVPIMLEPTTMLSIKNLRGGVTFGSTLPDITDPEDLRGPEFKPAGDLTLAEWDDRLKGAVADQAKAAAEARLRGEDFAALWVAFTQPMRIEAGGKLYFQIGGIGEKLVSADVDIIIDTEGRILIKGVLNALVVIKVPTWLYLNFSDVDVTNPDAIAVTLLALFDFPEIPQALTDALGIKPLLTARGSLIFQPLKDGLPLDIDPVEVNGAFSAPAVGGGFQVTFQIDPTRIDEFAAGTRIVVSEAVPATYDGEFVITAVDQLNSTITLRMGAAVIDGELDMDFDGIVDGDDAGTLPGVGTIIGGRVDVNGDGTVDQHDDDEGVIDIPDWLRRLLSLPLVPGLVIIDGRIDRNGDGVIDGADDDAVGIGDPGVYVGGARITLKNDEPDAFELALTGGVDFNIPFVTTLSLDGQATLTFTIDPAPPRIDFSFDAALSETNVGNIGRTVGSLHLVFDVGGNLTDIAAGAAGGILVGIAELLGGLLADVATAPPALASATDPGEDPEAEIAPARPVLILPGIGGSFAADGFREQWFTQRGVLPSDLQIDPLGQYYHDLVRTLRDVGYTLDQDLFVANYDWRMNPGPIDLDLLDAVLTNDSFDGFIGGLTAESITDDEFLYGVDYLGYWLDVASDQWEVKHGTRPSSVDIIAHSTGGLVARTYVQSAAYGGMTAAGYALPQINDLIMVGVPNRGASKAWNVLHDDWDVELAFRIVLSKAIAEAYARLTDAADPAYSGVISGPDYDILHHAGILDPDPTNTNIIAPSAEEFISLYVPTGRSLLATYAFLDSDGSGPLPVQTVNDQPSGTGARNAFVLDLNAGLDVDFDLAALDASANHTVLVGSTTRAPNAFIDLLLGSAVVIYADGLETPVEAIQHTGPGASSGKEILPFTSFIGRNPGPAEIWFEDVRRAEGDGTVPTISAAGQFVSDDLHLASGKLQIHAMTSAQTDPDRPTTLKGILKKGDNLDHTGLMAFTAAQREILTTLDLVEGVDFRVGVPPASNDVSFGLWNNPLQSLVRAVFLGILGPDDLHQLISEQLPLPKIEVWGAATLDTNFDFLHPLGIFASADGVLRLNTTDETKFEVLPQLTEFHPAVADVTVADTGSGFAVTVTLDADAAQFDVGDLVLVKNPDNRNFDGAFLVSAVATGRITSITYLMDSNPGVWVGTRGSLSPAREVELLPESFSVRLDGSLEFRIDFDHDGFESSERVFLIAGAFAMQFSRQGFDVAVFREDPASPTGLGPATLQIGPPGATFLQFNVFGFLAIRTDTTFNKAGGDGINNSGFAANLVVALDVSLPGVLEDIVDINGQFVVVINTTFEEVSFKIPVGADARAGPDGLIVAIPRGPPASVTNIDFAKLLTGDATAFGSPAAAAYVLVYIGGTDPSTNPDAIFKVAFFELVGKFSLLAKFDSQFFLDIEGDFALNITAGTTSLLSFTGQGSLRFDTSGLLAGLNLNLAAGIPSSFGFSLTATYRLELNTTGSTRLIAGIGNIDPGFRIHAVGMLTLAGFFVLDGTFDLEVNATGVSMRIHAGLRVFGFPFTVDGLAIIQGSPNPGIVFSIVLTAGGSNTTEITAAAGFNISGRFLFQVNTTGVTVSGVAPGLKIAVTDAAGTGPATINVLGFLMQGGVTIGISSTTGFSIQNFNASLNFFGLFSVNVSGFLETVPVPRFRLTASAGVNFNFAGIFSLNGSVFLQFQSFNPLFTGNLSGRVSVLGYTVSTSAALIIRSTSVTVGFRFTVTLIPSFRVWVPFHWVTVSAVTATINAGPYTLGQTKPPQNLVPDEPPPPPPPVVIPPDPVLARIESVGGKNVLFLNMGVDAALRDPHDENPVDGTLADPVLEEAFVVTHAGGVVGSETVEVSAFGFIQEYAGISRIVATDAGDGNDFIEIRAGVLSPAELDGGPDNDDLRYLGSGDATLNGSAGDDSLRGGSGINTMDGGPGNDGLEAGRGRNFLFGDEDDDTFVWDIASGGQLDRVEGGADLNDPANPFRDALRIVGTNAGEMIEVMSTGADFVVDFAGLSASTLGIEGLILDAQDGSDTITIHDLTGSVLGQISILLGSDGVADHVTFHGSPVADAYRLSIVENTLVGARVIDGNLNITNRTLTSGAVVIGGRVDFNGDGQVDNGDDDPEGTLLGIALIDGFLDVNNDGVINSDDDGLIEDAAGEVVLLGDFVFMENAVAVAIQQGDAGSGDSLTIIGNGGADDLDASAVDEHRLNMTFQVTDEAVAVLGSHFDDVINVDVVGDAPAQHVLGLDGQAGSDIYTITLTGSAATSIALTDTGSGPGTDAAFVVGTDQPDVFTLFNNALTLGTTTETINYSGLEELTITASDGADTINVNNLDLSILDLITLNLADGDGTPDAASDHVVLNGSAGQDTFEISSDSNTLFIDYTGGSASFTTRIEEAAPSDALTINGNGGADTIDAEAVIHSLLNMTVNVTNEADSVDGTQFADVINVLVVPMTIGDLLIDGHNGADAHTVALSNNADTVITIDDTGTDEATDVVTVYGTDGPEPDIFVLTDEALTLGANTESLSYSGLEEFTLNTLGDDDELTIFGTHVGPVTVNTGDGADTVIIHAISGPTTIDTGAGMDTMAVVDPLALTAPLSIDGADGVDLTLDFSGAVAGLDLTLTSGGLSGPSLPSGISYSGVSALSITLGSGNDTFNVQSTHATTPSTLDAGPGDDMINVGTLAPDAGGTVNGIAGPLTINGDEGNDTLNVDDTGDAALNTGTLTATMLTGLSTGVITYDALESLTIGLGLGNDTFDIQGTQAATPVTLDAGQGNDTINVGSLADTMNGISGPLTVNGGDGSDTLNVDDTGDTDSNTGTLTATTLTGLSPGVITYGALESLNIGLGLGGDTFTIASTHAGAATLGSNAGADTVNVQTISGATTVNAGSENDTIDVGSLAGTVNGIGALLTVNGGDGSDRLNVDDTGDAELNTGTLTATTLAGLGMPGGITYGTLESVNIGLGSGNDSFDVQGTHAATPVTLDAGPGNDTIKLGSLAGTVGGISGPLTVNGGDGSDTLNVDDTGDTASSTGTLTATTLTGLGMLGGITYGTLESVNIGLGLGGDTFTIESTHEGATTLGSNAGADTVNVNAAGAGGLTLDGQADSDTYTVNLGSLTGPVTVADSGDVGSDSLLVNGTTGDDILVLTATAVTRGPEIVNYSGIEDLTVNAADGNDAVTINGTQTTILGGAGIDTFTVNANGPGGLTLDGQEGSDSYAINLGSLAGSVTVADSGLAGTDSFAVNGTRGDDTITLTDTGVTTGTGESITYSGTESLTVDAGGGNNVIDGSALTTSVTMLGGPGNDLLIGGAGYDTMLGGEGDDVILGGAADDVIDGGDNRDLIFGDNVLLVWNAGSGDAIDPRFRTLTGTTIHDRNGIPQVSGQFAAPIQPVPGGRPAWADWTITLDQTLTAAQFGNDYIAGGPDDDTIFGQLGDDVIQGDGSILLSVSAERGSPLTINPSEEDFSGLDSDGDDYIEGNGGNDVIFGNLGQDDIIGGSSGLFGLNTASQRPDESDLIFGGAGTDISRNNLGDASLNPAGDAIITTPTGHAQDADMILGDNGNIYRLVGIRSALGIVDADNDGRDDLSGIQISAGYLAFNYDNYNTLKIIPRAAQLLDYTPGGPDFDADAAALDNGGADEIHGESGDDSIYGMTGDDILFGEGQDDDLIGGWGHDWISGGTGEDGVLGDDGRIYTSRNGMPEPLYGLAASSQQTISTPGNHHSAVIFFAGLLNKTVDLTPFNVDPNPEAQDPLYDALYADDIIYGGLGDDFLHGGVGDDAMSGAEALLLYYEDPLNPGDTLRFGGLRAGEFAAYYEFDPMRKVINADGTEFLLNFDAALADGNDMMFGDLGNDWIVGGTGRDWMFGGFGEDLINADDNYDTNGGANDLPDVPEASYEDIAYGGAGRDVLIANTEGDRLIDWVGNFNSYLVPFPQFGMSTISRGMDPHLQQFLYDLSYAGADRTRAADTGEDPLRNGEPHGEIGLVNQSDNWWQDQTGAPEDLLQADTHGKKDVLRGADFNNGSTQGFSPDSGTWTVQGGALFTSATTPSGDAVAIYHVGEQLPSYYELQATINAVKPVAGWKANSYVIFDYHSPSDFKFAGINVSLDKIELGHRDASGWHVDVQASNVKLKPDTYYNMLVAVNGLVVTVTVDNSQSFSYAFAPRLIDGVPSNLNWGYVGFGSESAKGKLDNIQVKVLERPFTLTTNESFDDGVADLFTGLELGAWQVAGGRYDGSGADPAVSLVDLGLEKGIQANARTELSVTLSTAATAGYVFDFYSADDFKFVLADTAADRILIGHRARDTWTVDASAAYTLEAGGDYELTISLAASTVSVMVDERAVVGHAFNGVVVDGAFGTAARGGSASFDDFTLKTSDSRFREPVAQMLVAAVAATTMAPSDGSVTETDLAPIVAEALERWSLALGADLSGILDGVAFVVGDLGGQALAQAVGNVVIIDVNAAGHGWFIDPTPYDDSEYTGQSPDGSLKAPASSPAYGRMDLLSVVMHEIGHLLGFGHDGAASGTVMAGTLETGTRVIATEGSTAAGGSGPALLAEDPTSPPSEPEPSDPAPPPNNGPGRGRKS